ncbi:hypothetical protein L916_11540 [Phytophthora nicotianae]|uniref:Amino acid transporter transmembrane domain-containing protein n=1 Tax=Phytophthora nicotianae TaxID=4792 RepID=W2IQG9_PHYNI|nr:hypothetical protein L916_11540 [Phytophthora nicotianae]
MGVCVLVPIAFLILGFTLLDVLFPDAFSQTFWIIFMVLMVTPICLIPTLKESAGIAFAGCMGTGIADVIAVSILQYNMRGHPSIPKPDVSVLQVITCLGNLALAYGAAIVIPDLQREHSQRQRTPLSYFAIALAGYTAGGCQISGNILYSIVDNANPMGEAPLGFSPNHGAVDRSNCVRFNDVENIEEDLELQEKHSSVQVSTLHEEVTEVQLRESYRGVKNTIRYITLRITIIVMMDIVAIAAQDKFLDLEDFTGSTAHTVNCMIVLVLIYPRFYVMIHTGKQLFTPSEDDTAFPYCDAEYQDEPYYIYNSSN